MLIAIFTLDLCSNLSFNQVNRVAQNVLPFYLVFFKIVITSNFREMEFTESVEPKKTSPKISSISVVNHFITKT